MEGREARQAVEMGDRDRHLVKEVEGGMAKGRREDRATQVRGHREEVDRRTTVEDPSGEETETIP